MKFDIFFSIHFPLLHQLRESLEESISQLQTQRQSRSNGARSASASTSPLHTSDLEARSGSGAQERQLLLSLRFPSFEVVTRAVLSECFRWSTFLPHLSAERLYRHKPSEEEVSLCLCSFQGCQSDGGGRKESKALLGITATC